jgi:hypothetical protein
MLPGGLGTTADKLAGILDIGEKLSLRFPLAGANYQGADRYLIGFLGTLVAFVSEGN